MALSLESGTTGIAPSAGRLSPLPASFPGVEEVDSCPFSHGSMEQCEQHGESLTVFCKDDLELICRECGETGSHAGHKVYHLAEAVTDCKGKLKTSLESMQKKVRQFGHVTKTCEHALRHNKMEAVKTEGQIKEEFEKLHQFLRDEEESRLATLREEIKTKRTKPTDRLLHLDQKVELLEENIREIEEDIEADVDEVIFLQDTMKKYKNCVAVIMPEKERQVCGRMLDVAGHLGNLRYTVWNKMKHIAPCTPVTLDPRTACPSLTLSPGLTSVQTSPQVNPTQGLSQDALVPDNPERFHPYSCIVSQEGYTSGTHFWEVEVGNSSNWTVGIAGQSLQRRREFEACPEAGLWVIGLRDGEYRAMTTPSQILPLDKMQSLRRICLHLNWDQGRLDLTDADTQANLFTFTHCFTEKLYPYFESICVHHGLAVLPQKVNVSLRPDPNPDEDASYSMRTENSTKGHTPSKKPLGKGVGTMNKTLTQRKVPTNKNKSVAREKAHATTKKSKGNINTEESSLLDIKSTPIKHNTSYHVSLNRSLKVMEHARSQAIDPCSHKEHQCTGTSLIS